MKLKNPEWVYTPASKTNILAKFKALGWIPPSELRKKSSAGFINN